MGYLYQAGVPATAARGPYGGTVDYEGGYFAGGAGFGDDSMGTSGGRSTRSWDAFSTGAPAYNTTVTVTIGAKGIGGAGGAGAEANRGSDGLPGQVNLSWSGIAGLSGNAASQFATSTPLVANPGTGAAKTAPGADGTATGGTTNTTGGGALAGAASLAGFVGGKGGRSQKTWARGDAGAPVPGTQIIVNVGGGGVGANAGSNGSVQLSWGA